VLSKRRESTQTIAGARLPAKNRSDGTDVLIAPPQSLASPLLQWMRQPHFTIRISEHNLPAPFGIPDTEMPASVKQKINTL
jgi:hypothetical protein